MSRLRDTLEGVYDDGYRAGLKDQRSDSLEAFERTMRALPVSINFQERFRPRFTEELEIESRNRLAKLKRSTP